MVHSKEGSSCAGGDANLNVDVLNMVVYSFLRDDQAVLLSAFWCTLVRCVAVPLSRARKGLPRVPGERYLPGGLLLPAHSLQPRYQFARHAPRDVVALLRFQITRLGDVDAARSWRDIHQRQQESAQQVRAYSLASCDSNQNRPAAHDGGRPALPIAPINPVWPTPARYSKDACAHAPTPSP